MSQNWMKVNSTGRKVLYGFDAPTGGFFWTEFFREDELDDEHDEIVSEADGLILSFLQTVMKKRFQFDVEIEMMIDQVAESEYPTRLQIKVGKIFDKDIRQLLMDVSRDLLSTYLSTDYYTYFQK